MLKGFAKVAGLLLAFTIPFSLAKAAEWRGIVPIKSTRQDVERILGKPDKNGRYQVSEDESATINYKSDYNCDDRTDCFCKAAKDTVLWILVRVEKETKFSSLKLDLGKYEKTISTNFSYNVTYSNDDEGIAYYVWDDEDEVHSIMYTPSSEDCPNQQN